MKKFVIMVAIAFLCFMLLNYNKASDFSVVYVNDDFDENTGGWNITCFNSIQGAINKVAENGTVFVYNGNYSENLSVNKNLKIFGENREKTFVNGKISIYGQVEVRNISSKGIEIFSSFNKIIDCNIFGGNGIYISNSTNNTIYRCIISNNNFGVYINSSYSNSIRRNNIINNSQNAFDNGDNIWEENYWSDLTDETYAIPGGDNKDLNPSLEPWDLTLPSLIYTISGESGKNGWYKSNVTISIEAFDNDEISKINYSINGLRNTTTNSSFNITLGEGIHNIEVYVFDKNENFIKEEFEIKVDTSSPSIGYIIDPSLPNGKNGWYRNVSISISANDSVSGMMDGSIDYNINEEGWQEYKGFFAVREEGYLNISIRAIDSAGNENITSFELKKDSTPPTITIGNLSGLFIKDMYELFWNATDNIDTDLNGSISLYYSPDNGTTWEIIEENIQNSGRYAWNTRLFNDSRNGLLKISAEDDAGNVGYAISQNFVLDNTPPVVAITSPKGEAYGKDEYGNIIIEIIWSAFDAIDDDLNGSINISLYNGTWFDIEKNYNNNFRYTITNASDWGDGQYTIRISASDDAGNTGFAYSNFTIDKQPPQLRIIKPSKGYLYINIFGKDIIPPLQLFGFLYDAIIIGKIKIEIYAYDTHSGLQDVRIKIDEDEPFPVEWPYQYFWDPPTGVHNIKVIARDNAKNIEEEEISRILCLNF
ncbi:MAG: right-handed parallel beta-helix repeat-containing protein [Thermoplasmatales archaeon]|nr:right-handed parallel beta-helix repeat-containing protein [Thermoplasmatales archaeon]